MSRSARIGSSSRGPKVGPLSSLGDALQVVFEFTRTDEEEITVTSLSRRLALPKSKISRVLATFREAGWLDQNPRTRAYKVGLKAYAVGARFLNASALTREAMPILRGIVDRSGFASALCVLDGLDLRSNGFGIEPEITAKIFKRGYRVYEVPITYDGRGYDEGKKITWKDGIVALWVLFRNRIG